MNYINDAYNYLYDAQQRLCEGDIDMGREYVDKARKNLSKILCIDWDNYGRKNE